MDRAKQSEPLRKQAAYSITGFGRLRAIGSYAEGCATISPVYPEERLASELFQRRFGWSHPIAGTVGDAMEALLISLIRPSESVLVLVNGPLGRRMADLSERLEADVILIEQSWGEPFDSDDIERELRKHRPSLLAVAHGEWVTGRCQPLDRIGKLCGELDIRIVADCTATAGRMPIRSEEWHLDAAFGSIGADSDVTQGTTIVSYNDRILAKQLHRRWGDSPFLQLCEDWRNAKRYPASFGEQHASAESALQQWMDDGRRNGQVAEERLHAEALEQGMHAMGLLPAMDTESKLPYAACAWVPRGVDGKEISRRLQEVRGFRLDQIERRHSNAYWSIAAIGKQADRCRVLELLAVLETELLGAGFRFTRGSAVQAATERYGREPGRSMMDIGGMIHGEAACELE
ncbi:aminotransferase class V-fold PLP-dependent enzyme [Paenibacillus sp. NPDC057967]|uniref:aminotransferase class V-fold PLP-dependent enzyme n=1 Tax=Paenibacillus sp. NPDC057967 TaxID=3346293 RepID=UPI0036DA31F3